MRKQEPKKCPKCKHELGLACIRYKSQNGSVKRIKDVYYCEACEKFTKLVEEFEEF